MTVNFEIIKCISVTKSKNPDFDICYCLISAKYSGITTAKPMTIICPSGLLTVGVMNTMVTGTVSTKKGHLSIFAETLNLRKKA